MKTLTLLTQEQSLSLITNFQEKFNYKYCYALSVIKTKIKDSGIDDNSVYDALCELIKYNSINTNTISNELYRHIVKSNNIDAFNKYFNDYYIFSYKVVNNNKDSNHFNTVHIHSVLLSKIPIDKDLLNKSIIINKNSMMIKEMYYLDGFVNYIYEKHFIYNNQIGKYDNIRTITSHIRDLVNCIDIVQKYLNTPLKTLCLIVSIQYISIVIKTNKGIYNKYVYL